MKTDEVINNFREFLIASWTAFTNFNRDLSYKNTDEGTIIEERTNNWLQANWEILVESSIMEFNEFLHYYGDGADCNDTNRVIYPGKSTTHKIICKLKSGDFGINLISGNKVKGEDVSEATFERFGTLTEKKDYFIDDLPFDCVLLQGKVEIFLKVEDVYFDVKKVNNITDIYPYFLNK